MNDDQMLENQKDNIILFPKTIEYYQIQLTRMLESERYEEAVQLLEFLLNCKGEHTAVYEEWSMLLEWLQTQLSDMEWQDVTEDDLIDENIRNKIKQDHSYIERLLHALKEESPIENQILALEQLSYTEHPQIEQTLKAWLKQQDSHPLIQFKALQTLKKTGASGKISLTRHGELAQVNIEDVPLHLDDFPKKFHLILKNIKENCEIHHPALSYFTERLWEELLLSAYATADYKKMANLPSEQVVIWAASLHYLSEELMLGFASKESVFLMYGLENSDTKVWEEASQTISKYVLTELPLV